MDINDPRFAKALAHPVRVRVLGILERKVASPNMLAGELGMPVSNVSYHVRQLLDLGLVELVAEEPRRGAVEHYYRALKRPRITDDAWSQVPDIVKHALVGATLDQLAPQVTAAAEQGGFTREGAHLSRMPVVLDDQGWKELSAELTKLLDRVGKIQDGARKRINAGKSERERVATMVMMLFEAAEEAADVDANGKPVKAAKGKSSRSRSSKQSA